MELLEGALGAILDEYKKASEELIFVLKRISKKNFISIIDHETNDDDCRSIQTILQHVIRSGYSYANYILDASSIPYNSQNIDKLKIENSKEATIEIRNMIVYNVYNLYELNREKIVTNLFSTKIATRWNQEYDIEQLLEHAVVHVLRHRRQVEKFIGILKNI